MKVKFDAAFGHYRMSLRKVDGGTQVTMYDVAALRFPMLWSHLMSDEQASAAKELFEAVGYFEIM